MISSDRYGLFRYEDGIKNYLISGVSMLVIKDKIVFDYYGDDNLLLLSSSIRGIEKCIEAAKNIPKEGIDVKLQAVIECGVMKFHHIKAIEIIRDPKVIQFINNSFIAYAGVKE